MEELPIAFLQIQGEEIGVVATRCCLSIVLNIKSMSFSIKRLFSSCLQLVSDEAGIY